MNDAPQDLIGNLLDGTPDEPSRQRLAAAARKDRELLREISSHLRTSEALSRLHPERGDELFIRSVAAHVLALGPEADDEFPARVRHRLLRRRASGWLAAAAAVILASTASFLIFRTARAPAGPVATITRIGEKGDPSPESRISPGYRHDSPSGLFRLNFSNGAVVAIEGPASFEILSGNAMRLTSGKLNAWCPDTAHGFRVVTETGTVTDLGTSFAVSTSGSGGSDFLVLDGLIEVSQGRRTVRLDQGKAVRTDSSPGIKDVAFQPDAFNRTWPLASGILATRGSVSPAPPGTAEQLAQLEDDHVVLVIPERRNVPFSQPIQAEMTAPGTFPASNGTEIHTLPAEPGRSLRSYLVRYNPSEKPVFRRFEGEVTFDRPVVAICCQGKYLAATDPAFSTGSWASADPRKTAFRGVDTDQPSGYPDVVRLSEDRHTVHVTFNAGISTDDIRVIVADDLPEMSP